MAFIYYLEPRNGDSPADDSCPILLHGWDAVILANREDTTPYKGETIPGLEGLLVCSVDFSHRTQRSLRPIFLCPSLDCLERSWLVVAVRLNIAMGVGCGIASIVLYLRAPGSLHSEIYNRYAYNCPKTRSGLNCPCILDMSRDNPLSRPELVQLM